MRNPGAWTRSKFESDSIGGWRANRAEVPIMSRLMVDRLAQMYAGAIGTHVRGRLADLGCGSVPLYEMYRDKVVDTVCVDWPASLHGSVHVDHFADLNEPLELEPGSFDTVLVTDVIEHLHSPQTLFASAARALRPGGKLIIGVPFLYWIHEAPHDFYRYTRFALEKLVADAKLTVVSITPIAGAPEVVVDLATKAVASRPRLARLIHTVCCGLLNLPPVRKLSAATRELMPLGYVLVARKAHDTDVQPGGEQIEGVAMSPVFPAGRGASA